MFNSFATLKTVVFWGVFQLQYNHTSETSLDVHTLNKNDQRYFLHVYLLCAEKVLDSDPEAEVL